MDRSETRDLPVGAGSYGASGWARIAISKIEDLRDAVLGAGLDATQVSSAPLTGSLAFAERDGVVFSSGLIHGHVSLRGPLSQSMVTLGLGVSLAPGTRHWLHEVSTGLTGVFMPGDEHDSLYLPGSIYATVSASKERFEEIAARAGRVLEMGEIGGTGIGMRLTDEAALHDLQTAFAELHTAHPGAGYGAFEVLNVLVEHFGRLPRRQVGPSDFDGYARIVRISREYIAANLQEDMSMESIAIAAGTSVRTLFRAFQKVLGESPHHHVRGLRLNRIRRELLSSSDSSDNITRIAHRWRMGELGRFSAGYRTMFGELPSDTRRRRKASKSYSSDRLAGFA